MNNADEDIDVEKILKRRKINGRVSHFNLNLGCVMFLLQSMKVYSFF